MAGQGTVGARDARGRPRRGRRARPGRRRRPRLGDRDRGQGTASPDARVFAIEPELSNALAASMAAGESVTVEPRPLADGLNGPYAGPELRPHLPRPRRRERARHRGRDSTEGFRFMYGRMKLALRGSPAPPRRPRCSPGKVELEPRQHRRRGRLGRQRGCPNGRCYPGRAMKTGIHPEYVVATRALLLRQRVRHALDEAGAARRGVLELPPVLHGQAEADGHRRPRRALPAPAREGRAARGAAASRPTWQSATEGRPSSRA